MPARRHVEKLQKDGEFVSSLEKKLKFVQRDFETPCLEWLGGTDKAGYGRIHVKRHCERKTGRNFFAHRIVYMVKTGAYIDPDEYILHQCHNRLCCNPDHFMLGDHIDNMDDLHYCSYEPNESQYWMWSFGNSYHDAGNTNAGIAGLQIQGSIVL